MICPECNTPAQKGDTYCQNCGHQFVINPVRTGVDPETGQIIPGTVIAPGGQVIPTSPILSAQPQASAEQAQPSANVLTNAVSHLSTPVVVPSQASSVQPTTEQPVFPQPAAMQTQSHTAPSDHIFSDRPTVSDEKFMSAGVAAGRENRSHARHKAVNAIIGTLVVLTLIGSAYFIGFHTDLFGLGQPDEPTYSLPLEGTPAVSD